MEVVRRWLNRANILLCVHSFNFCNIKKLLCVHGDVSWLIQFMWPMKCTISWHLLWTDTQMLVLYEFLYSISRIFGILIRRTPNNNM